MYQYNEENIYGILERRLMPWTYYFLCPEMVFPNKCPNWTSCFFRLFWVGHMESFFICPILFRLQWRHAMFFIDSGDIKFGPFWIYTFHNMINEIDTKRLKQRRHLFGDGGSISVIQCWLPERNLFFFSSIWGLTTSSNAWTVGFTRNFRKDS